MHSLGYVNKRILTEFGTSEASEEKGVGVEKDALKIQSKSYIAFSALQKTWKTLKNCSLDFILLYNFLHLHGPEIIYTSYLHLHSLGYVNKRILTDLELEKLLKKEEEEKKKTH